MDEATLRVWNVSAGDGTVEEVREHPLTFVEHDATTTLWSSVLPPLSMSEAWNRASNTFALPVTLTTYRPDRSPF